MGGYTNHRFVHDIAKEVSELLHFVGFEVLNVHKVGTRSGVVSAGGARVTAQQQFGEV